MKPKVFTLEKAKSALPLVSRIVGDVKDTYAAILSKKEEFIGRAADESTGEEVHEFQKEIQDLVSTMNDFIEELTQLGVELKDPQTGLIDFYGRHDDRLVYLCWRHGEDTIDFWHELDAGFAGRQPVSALNETD